MTSIASSSISRRTPGGGQPAPTTCSFRFSPVPTPRKKRPGIKRAAVAAAWATTAGCWRMIGHVTPVPIRIRDVACAMAPSTVQTCGLCPWAPIQGWKWSEMRAYAKPASSARRTWATSSSGGNSSLERV